jgi:hypothetical protein
MLVQQSGIDNGNKQAHELQLGSFLKAMCDWALSKERGDTIPKLDGSSIRTSCVESSSSKEEEQREG